MELLRFTTAGSVDDGKSTLIGRLLYDTKSLFEDRLADIERTSLLRGETEIDLALFTDGLRAEREQRITIDVAYHYFSTPKRKFIIADTPGHVQYTRNMVTGASTATLAILLVDARKGSSTQSRRHAFLSSLLGISQLVVAVNKMDLVDYSKERFEEIREEFRSFLSLLDAPSYVFIPISALRGDNIVDRSQNMPWYDGPVLLQHLENVNTGTGVNKVDFRFPVQCVLRPNQDFRGFAGQLTSGRIRPGDEVSALPSGKTSRIQKIYRHKEELDVAIAGDSVVMTLEHEIDVSRGDLLVRTRNLPHKATHVDAILCWMSEEPLQLGKSYWVSHTTRQLRGQVRTLEYRIDVDTMQRQPAETLQLNEMGRIELEVTSPLFFDRYKHNHGMGSFVLIDETTNNTVAAGMIRGASRSVVDLKEPVAQAEGTKNVVWAEGGVTLNERARRNGHRAGVLWFTGLSGAGKSTITKLLEQKLFEQGCQVVRLDGDNLRHGLNSDLGFTAEDRDENVRRFGEVAKICASHGCLVLCSLIAPSQEARTKIRQLFEPETFLEVFVDCSLEVCKKRDPKKLYERAAGGEIENFTGIDAPYERPQNAEIVLDTEVLSPEDAVKTVLARLADDGWFR